MNTRTKYYFIVKNVLLFFVLNLVIGFITRTISRYVSDKDILDTVKDLLNVCRGLFITAMIIGLMYLAYLIYLYYVSAFFKKYKINIFEAMYYGFADIHLVYEKVSSSTLVTEYIVDFKRSIITFSTKQNHYSVIFADLFGKIEGKVDSEYWYQLSRPTKEYNKKSYKKRLKFKNPYRINANYIYELKQKTGMQYKNYVVTSGFYRLTQTSDNIIAAHEIVDLFKD